MQFCFYSGFNQMLQEKGLDETAAWAQENGFSSVEFLQLPIENWHAGVDSLPHAKQVNKRLRDFGLSTACYSVGVNLLNGEQALSFLKKHAELAAELGSPFLHHTLIDSLILDKNAPTFEEVFPIIVDRATEIATYCKSLGLTCLYEEQGMYFNGVESFGRFYREIQKRCQNVGVCGDFGNILFVDESPTDFFRAFQTEIKHVHLKNYRRVFSPNDAPLQEGWLPTKNGAYLLDTSLEQGIVDVRACMKILRENRYKGAFSLEIVEPTKNNAPAMALAKKLFET